MRDAFVACGGDRQGGLDQAVLDFPTPAGPQAGPDIDHAPDFETRHLLGRARRNPDLVAGDGFEFRHVRQNEFDLEFGTEERQGHAPEPAGPGAVGWTHHLLENANQGQQVSIGLASAFHPAAPGGGGR